VTVVYQQQGLDHFCLVAQSLKKCLNTDTRPGAYFEIPRVSYNPLRKQYNPEHIINEIAKLNGSSSESRIGLVDVDIYARGLNFIFGLANPLRGIALVSVYRLSGPQLEERIAKEVVHEMAHLLGLDHCADPGCVMYFSNTLDDTDQKSKDLCRLCRSKLET